VRIPFKIWILYTYHFCQEQHLSSSKILIVPIIILLNYQPLSGIDTPELKEKQAFAEEAKAYTRNLCHKKNIWLTFEHEEKDHYGRLLAFVWVKAPQGKGYLCVNEGIIAEGLATAYTPGGKKLHNWDKLIDMQKRARETKRGMWVNFNDYSVLKTSNGSAFHQRNCKHISKSRNLVQLKASEAMDKGLHPCRTCLADK